LATRALLGLWEFPPEAGAACSSSLPTRNVARAAGAKVIDMVPVYRRNRDRRPFNTWDFVHPTAAGHELEAAELMKELLNTHPLGTSRQTSSGVSVERARRGRG